MQVVSRRQMGHGSWRIRSAQAPQSTECLHAANMVSMGAPLHTTQVPARSISSSADRPYSRSRYILCAATAPGVPRSMPSIACATPFRAE